ncbi:MAG TPA: glycosyltransferase family 4 protein [Pyrinomonadaceae bacterium]|nr:glycosyltransferase family 4 protein [Pyrinomonadaceae bacterium]
MSRQNIAILLDSAPITWTSQEDRHLKLCEALVEQGAAPLLVFSEDLSQEFAARLRGTGAELAAINYGEGTVHYFRELRRLVQKHSITTAHIIFFDYFSAVPWIARLAGIPNIIYEMQNSGVFQATSWRKTLLQLRTKLMTRPTTLVIAISQFVKEQLVKGGLAEDKIVVRYLGVDTERFAPDPSAREQWARDFNIHPDEIVLSTVSYLRPFKNPQVLVHTCNELARRKVPARLFVAGDGEMLSGLKELSRQLGVEDRIHWLGNVPDPRSLLQASDIFLLASVGEAFGLVLAEAMACGLPVIGSRSGSLLEVVDEGRTGLLATPLDSNSFADAVERLAKDPDLRRKMGRQAVEHISTKFTVAKAVEETIRIYDSL